MYTRVKPSHVNTQSITGRTYQLNGSQQQPGRMGAMFHQDRTSLDEEGQRGYENEEQCDEAGNDAGSLVRACSQIHIHSGIRRLRLEHANKLLRNTQVHG